MAPPRALPGPSRQPSVSQPPPLKVLPSCPPCRHPMEATIVSVTLSWRPTQDLVNGSSTGSSASGRFPAHHELGPRIAYAGVCLTEHWTPSSFTHARHLLHCPNEGSIPAGGDSSLDAKRRSRRTAAAPRIRPSGAPLQSPGESFSLLGRAREIVLSIKRHTFRAQLADRTQRLPVRRSRSILHTAGLGSKVFRVPALHPLGFRAPSSTAKANLRLPPEAPAIWLSSGPVETIEMGFLGLERPLRRETRNFDAPLEFSPPLGSATIHSCRHVPTNCPLEASG